MLSRNMEDIKVSNQISRGENGNVGNEKQMTADQTLWKKILMNLKRKQQELFTMKAREKKKLKKKKNRVSVKYEKLYMA